MTETEAQWNEIERATKNPLLLLSADARESLTYLAEEGDSEKIRLEASRLLAAVPCPSCVE